MKSKLVKTPTGVIETRELMWCNNQVEGLIYRYLQITRDAKELDHAFVGQPKIRSNIVAYTQSKFLVDKNPSAEHGLKIITIPF